MGSGDSSRSSLEAQGLNNRDDYTNESAVEVRDGGTIDLGGVTTTISALAGDVASSGGAIANDASATYPAMVTVQNGQLAVEKNKSRYALFTVGSGYASAAPAATLDGTTAEGWALALQGRVLTLLNPHPRGLLVIVR